MSLLPPPPRTVPLRTALSLWWPFGLTVGAVWLVLSVLALVLLAQDGFRLPTVDLQIADSQRTDFGVAEIVGLEPTGIHLGSRQLERAQYRATVDGRRFEGHSYGWSGTFELGGKAGLDMLREDVGVQRLHGGFHAIASTWMPWFGGWIWLPLSLLLGFWLARVYRLRVLLRNGKAAAAELLAATPRRLSNPAQLAVRYRFVAADGQVRLGWRWLRLSSPLAQRLLQAAPQTLLADAAVVYAESAPQQHRLVAREHFAGA